jgi:hypothetical protein
MKCHKLFCAVFYNARITSSCYETEEVIHIELV